MYKSYIQIERVCGKKHVPVHEFGRRTPARKKIKNQNQNRNWAGWWSGCVQKPSACAWIWPPHTRSKWDGNHKKVKQLINNWAGVWRKARACAWIWPPNTRSKWDSIAKVERVCGPETMSLCRKKVDLQPTVGVKTQAFCPFLVTTPPRHLINTSPPTHWEFARRH